MKNGQKAVDARKKRLYMLVAEDESEESSVQEPITEVPDSSMNTQQSLFEISLQALSASSHHSTM